ncbi:hypothetical protein PMAYCL1PPCAC_07111, partial [Pristionchus mayeri]
LLSSTSSMRSKHHCTFCLAEITPSDHCVGVSYSSFLVRRKEARKKKAFVLHDTCLASISQKKEKVLPAMEALLFNSNAKMLLEKYCIFESKMRCFECKKALYLTGDGKRKIVHCSDHFCQNTFHWQCALTNSSCRMDFYHKT